MDYGNSGIKMVKEQNRPFNNALSKELVYL